MVSDKFKEFQKRCIFTFPHGSILYGTDHEDSDIDIIAVCLDSDYNSVCKDAEALKGENYDITVYPVMEWREKVKNLDVDAVEAFLDGVRESPYHCVNASKAFDNAESMLELTVYPECKEDYTKIYENFSREASNSWVKCKKKLTVEKDCDYIGKKSLWHSLRLLTFAIQLMMNGDTCDLTSATYLYNEVMKRNTWEELKEDFQPLYNNLKSTLKSAHDYRLYTCERDVILRNIKFRGRSNERNNIY